MSPAAFTWNDGVAIELRFQFQGRKQTESQILEHQPQVIAQLHFQINRRYQLDVSFQRDNRSQLTGSTATRPFACSVVRSFITDAHGGQMVLRTSLEQFFILKMPFEKRRYVPPGGFGRNLFIFLSTSYALVVQYIWDLSSNFFKVKQIMNCF